MTLDVRSVYSNIPNDNNIKACKEMLDTNETLSLPTEDIVQLIKIILQKNNFTFNNQYYLQVPGTLIGTRITLSYPNIYMGKPEIAILQRACKKNDSLVEIHRRLSLPSSHTAKNPIKIPR